MMEMTARSQRMPTQRMLLLLGIASIVMLFAGLTSGYIVRRADGNWLQFSMPVAFYISTAILLFSSATMHFAVIYKKKNNLKLVRNSLITTLGLGLAFIFFQFLGWSEMVDNQVFYSGNPSGSFVYVISALHVAHVAGGIIGLMVTSAKAIMEKYNAQNYSGLTSCAIYWHFLDGLWIYLFVFLAVYR